MDLAKQYQKKTDREHILDAPDTYIGSTLEDNETSWIHRDGAIVRQEYKWVPGLFKIFDEGAVNMRDHYVRLFQMSDQKNIIPVTLLDFVIDKEMGVITMTNDGNGIDIAKHPEHKLWIPEMIFGHLRTSTNYKKEEKKIVGGKNGFGVKLIMIYSLWARIETLDHIRKKKYTQEFKNNLTEICPPKIRKSSSSKPYTKISFLPDYDRFGVDGLTDDMYNLFVKRIYDLAAITHKSVRVRLNGDLIPIRTLEQYIDMYIGDKSETKRVFEKISDRWELAVCVSPLDEFTHVSFVNGIYTRKGGKHIDYLLNQLTKKLISYIEKKRKVRVKPSTIKEQLMIFANCVIENPSFDSQTKDFLTTPFSRFGSGCTLSDKFIDKVAKLGIVENAIQLNELKENKSAKKTDGRRTKFVKGLPKLIDANWAGTSRGKYCTLILCEGDSAKAGIVSGLSKEDRDKIGVFPLKGKLLNTKDTSLSKINNNAEISAIKKIIGLETNKKYDQKEMDRKFRYGKILFMTDQDLDGAHIKGLCINLFESQWSELIQTDQFLGFMNTPIIKATKGKTVKSFYNDLEYNKWRTENNTKGWRIKYYKGLGTSTAKEFKEYFKQKKVVYFKYKDDTCTDSLDLVFNKKRADDRKDWLATYDKESSLNTNVSEINYSEFVHQEMIHYSKYDCERSIPNMMDGQKTSNRKILFAGFKRKLTKEMKVAQFGGYVAEHSCYHHGEASLQKAIVGMAQEFVGSNNIPLFMPNGQFGTRLQGGKDSASERYIFTQLNPLTKFIFPDSDMPVLAYLDDDGTMVEPDFYAPIIPMVLVNGTKGIGTGFSTDIPSYNPLKLVQYVRTKLNEGTDYPKLLPHYEGFRGKITQVGKKYLCKGKYKILQGNRIHVTELPVGMWTDTYKEFLETLMGSKDSKKKPLVVDYKDMSNSVSVDILITLTPGVLGATIAKKADYGCSLLEKTFKLYTTKTVSNMHLFDENQQMKKYKKVEDIIEDYFPVRYLIYVKRKLYMKKQLEKIVKVLHNKARFIEEQCEDIIDLRKKKKAAVNSLLKDREYNKVNGEYTYLISMPLSSVIEENIEKLRKERDEKKQQLEDLKKISEKEMWLQELDQFEGEYKKYLSKRRRRQNGS